LGKSVEYGTMGLLISEFRLGRFEVVLTANPMANVLQANTLVDNIKLVVSSWAICEASVIIAPFWTRFLDSPIPDCDICRARL